MINRWWVFMRRERQGRQLVPPSSLWSRLAGSQKAGNGISRWNISQWVLDKGTYSLLYYLLRLTFPIFSSFFILSQSKVSWRIWLGMTKRVLRYCFPLLLFCVQSKMRTNLTGNKCDWMECNYCKQMKIGQSTFNHFESGVQRKTAK